MIGEGFVLSPILMIAQRTSLLSYFNEVRCRRPITDRRGVAFSLFLAAVIIFSPTIARDSWWDTDWQYRKPVTVTENAGTTLAEYQVKVSIDTASLVNDGKLRSDCADLRAADDAGDAIDYWLESRCNTADTIIWLQIPSLASGTDTNAYLYYGNPSIASTASDEMAVFSYTAARTVAYIVSDINAAATLAITPFRDGTSVKDGSSTKSVDQGVVVTFNPSTHTEATVVQSNKPIMGSFGSETCDAVAPVALAGTTFTTRIDRGTQVFNFVSPFGSANVVIKEGSSLNQKASFQVSSGGHEKSSTDITDGKAVVITSDIPVLAYHYGSTYDAFALVPADTDFWGVPSTQLQIGIIEDGTSFTVYQSSGTSNSYSYDSGDALEITGFSSQGAGTAVHIVSNKPIGANGLADGDGGEAQFFLPEEELGTEYVIPQAAEYIAIATTEPGTVCTLYGPSGAQSDQKTAGSQPRPFPNKILFGSASAGSRVVCDDPVHAYYEYTTTDDEQNLWPAKLSRQHHYPEPTYVIGTEELATVCGANGCETGEDYTSCPQDCCDSDGTATDDTVCHSQCDGKNGATVSTECNSQDVGSGNVCSGAEGRCSNTCDYTDCPGCSDCSGGACSIDDQTECAGNAGSCACSSGTCTACGGTDFCQLTPSRQCTACSTQCDGACQTASCHGTDPDCDASGGATETCCGNTKCEGAASESCSACAADCGACPEFCGDGTCEAGKGENECTCSGDCGTCGGDAPGICKVNACVSGTCQVIDKANCCGNSMCDSSETYASCPGDCPVVCGDGKCEGGAGETCLSCATDCGVCAASCGDGSCDASEGENKCTCPLDCGVCSGQASGTCRKYSCEQGQCQAVPQENCCGNRQCDASETPDSCPWDCVASCGNGLCERLAREDCQTCPLDCGECVRVCGDGSCDPELNETKCTCPLDCGQCSGGCGTCKHNMCLDGNCTCAFIDNCCGNEACEFGETFKYCPQDCHPASLDLELISPPQGTVLQRGDTVDIRVLARIDNEIPAADATIKASGFFDNVILDQTPEAAAVFATTATISSDLPEGDHTFSISAGIKTNTSTVERDTVALITGSIAVTSRLILTLATDDQMYEKSQIIMVTGMCMDIHGKPVATDVDLVISHDNSPLLKKEFTTDTSGVFTQAYHTSLVDPEGNWTISAQASDTNNNTGSSARTITVMQPEMEHLLRVIFESPSPGTYQRGDVIVITVRVLQGDEPVDGATVRALSPNGESISLQAMVDGMYSRKYTLDWDDPLGVWKLEVTASGLVEGISYSGSQSIITKINDAPIDIKVLEPTRSSFAVGESVPVKVRVAYTTGDPVKDPTITALIAGQELTLKRVEEGVYAAAYEVSEEDPERLNVSIAIEDESGNVGTHSLDLEVAGTSFLHNVKKHKEEIVKYGLLILVIVTVLCYSLCGWMSRKNLESEIADLKSLQEKLQKDYYQRGSVDYESFDELNEQYDTRIKELRILLAARGVDDKAAESVKDEAKSTYTRTPGHYGAVRARRPATSRHDKSKSMSEKKEVSPKPKENAENKQKKETSSSEKAVTAKKKKTKVKRIEEGRTDV